MNLPSVAPEMLHAAQNRLLSRYVPKLGISLSEMDYLRGHSDDFFGKAIDTTNQYTTTAVGGGSSGALLDAAHGGVYQLTSGAGIGNAFTLWLGNAADGFDTLDADSGWVMIGRWRLPLITNVTALVGAADSTIASDYVLSYYQAALSANWILLTNRGGGAATVTDSGIAADTDWHYHVLDVYPITGGRQADYKLDGALIATTTTEVPTVEVTPVAYVYSASAAAHYLNLDFWRVIPRNLA